MSVNNLHIGIFGRRNTGKSSLINMITGQDISIVSDVPGTTTDPVKKSVEIFDIGPAILIDTAGIDDLGEIGSKKIRKSQEVIRRVDCAILLIAGNQFGDYEVKLIEQFQKNEVPYLIAHNKSDIDKIAAITKSHPATLPGGNYRFQHDRPGRQGAVNYRFKADRSRSSPSEKFIDRRSCETRGCSVAHHPHRQ